MTAEPYSWITDPVSANIHFKSPEDRMSRPKDQDQDEPATPTGSQSRTLRWTGSRLTLRELRAWLNPLPDQAYIEVWFGKVNDVDEMCIFANWEVQPGMSPS